MGPPVLDKWKEPGDRKLDRREWTKARSDRRKLEMQTIGPTRHACSLVADNGSPQSKTRSEEENELVRRNARTCKEESWTGSTKGPRAIGWPRN
jgi:hypothetical protein